MVSFGLSILAHRHDYEITGVLHGDISLNTLMVANDGEGLLLDLEW